MPTPIHATRRHTDLHPEGTGSCQTSENTKQAGWREAFPHHRLVWGEAREGVRSACGPGRLHAFTNKLTNQAEKFFHVMNRKGII